MGYFGPNIKLNGSTLSTVNRGFKLEEYLFHKKQFTFTQLISMSIWTKSLPIQTLDSVKQFQEQIYFLFISSGQRMCERNNNIFTQIII